MHPVALDTSLAPVLGSKGEEALNVWEIGRAEFGEQPRAERFQAEIRWLGIRSTPASRASRSTTASPSASSGGSRRGASTYLRDFENLEEAGEVIGAFIERYDTGWLLQRHGYPTPARAREKLSRKAA